MVIDNLREGGFEIIRNMIAKEWSIVIKKADGASAVICFHKGTWFVAKYTQGTYIGGFALNDAPDVSACNDELLEGLLLAYLDQTSKEAGVNRDCRSLPSTVICRTLEIWFGKLNKVEAIEILQEKRNSTIDLDTGKIRINS